MSNENNKSNVVDEFAEFDSASVINDGVKIELKHPDGSASKHWLMIRNYRSDAYRDALNSIKARIAEKGNPDDKVRAEDRLNLLASLISNWSFNTKLTHETAKRFLTGAVLVGEQVDKACVDDASFFQKGAKLS